MTKFTGKHISTLQNYTLSDQPEPCPREKVRIAVIDSGVREEDVEIAAAVATGQIRGCRNFTSLDPNDCEDHIKHGTMVARLLLTVAPEAELYIAKVSNQKKMPKSQLHRIAEVRVRIFPFMSKIIVFKQHLNGCEPKTYVQTWCHWDNLGHPLKGIPVLAPFLTFTD
jgi:hypothetical protein